MFVAREGMDAHTAHTARRRDVLAALAFLALLTGLLYHDALNASWRADDGAHLGFVSLYAPWQYFFIPEITREFSSASVTPWNALTYSMNLALFGLHPRGFYAHQLVSLWLAAAVTMGFLRLWLPLRWAMFGAVLFLVAPPSAHIANELMTGHYLEGLVFAVGAAWCFVLAVRRDSWRHALGGATLYLLATTCKEIYVPLPAMLLMLPEGHWRSRIRYLLPFGAVGLAYIGWRFMVLGEFVGGYQSAGPGYAQVHALRQLADIPTLLFGENLLGYAAIACIAATGVLALRRRPRHLPMVLVFAVLVIGPLVPLTLYPGLSWADRYFFFVWWVAAALLAAALGSGLVNRHVCVAIAVVILAGTAVRGRWELGDLTMMHSMYESYLRFGVSSGDKDVLVLPPDKRDYVRNILGGIGYAQHRQHPDSRARSTRLVDEELLTQLDTRAMRLFRYDPACRCLVQVVADATRPPKGPVENPDGPRFRVDVMLLTQPYRPRPEVLSGDGQVESIVLEGSTLMIEGWAPLRFDGLGPRLLVGIPVLPRSKEVARVAQTTAGWSPRQVPYAGFRITLRYASAADAARSARSVCVASDAGELPVTLLENARNPACAQLLRH